MPSLPSADLPLTQTYSRPLGLRFAIELVNSEHAAANWQSLSDAHGDAAFGQRTVDQAALEAATSRIRGIIAMSDPAAAAEALTSILSAEGRGTALVQIDDHRWALRPVLHDHDSAAEAVLLVAAFGLAEWLTERGRCAWGVCAATNCERVFIDEGRRAPQRFCSTPCATRTRVAAHRRRD